MMKNQVIARARLKDFSSAAVLRRCKPSASFDVRGTSITKTSNSVTRAHNSESEVG